MKQNWKRFMTALLLSLAFALLVPGIMPQQTATVSAKTTAKAKEKNKKSKNKKNSKISLNKQSKTLYRRSSIQDELDLRVKGIKGTKTRVKWKVSDPSVLRLKKKGKYAVTVYTKKSGQATVTATVGKKKLKCVVTVIDKVEEEAKRQAACASKRDQIYLETGVNSAMKDQYKCFILAKWICDHIVYAFGSEDGQTYEEALLEGTAVCAGVTNLYRYLLEGQNIPCNYLTGVSMGSPHAWNQVQIDGEWYNVDVTWMGVVEPEEKALKAQNPFPEINYNMYYFLFPDDAKGYGRELKSYTSHQNATSHRFWFGDDEDLEYIAYKIWFNGEWVNY